MGKGGRASSLEIQVSGDSPAGVSKDWLRSAVALVLRSAGLSEGEISLTLLDDDSIRELNRTYLGKDTPTDVLSFALHEGDEAVLGDVYVGYEQAANQAVDAGITAEEELAVCPSTARCTSWGTTIRTLRPAPPARCSFCKSGWSRSYWTKRCEDPTLRGMTTSHSNESPDLRERIAALIGEGDISALEAMLEELHPSDIADVVESLAEELRLALVRALPADLASETLTEMEEGEVGPSS